MNLLVIINDPPYGTERAYNALRLAYALVQRENVQVSVFLIGDGAACARRGQQTPNGYYNLERMLSAIARRRGSVGVCGTCMDARGIADGDIIEGLHRSSMDELATWTLAADLALTF